MGKFLKSALSTVIGAVLVVVSPLPLGDVVELFKSGEILAVIGAAVGGALMGAGHPRDGNRDEDSR